MQEKQLFTLMVSNKQASILTVNKTKHLKNESSSERRVLTLRLVFLPHHSSSEVSSSICDSVDFLTY